MTKKREQKQKSMQNVSCLELYSGRESHGLYTTIHKLEILKWASVHERWIVASQGHKMVTTWGGLHPTLHVIQSSVVLREEKATVFKNALLFKSNIFQPTKEAVDAVWIAATPPECCRGGASVSDGLDIWTFTTVAVWRFFGLPFMLCSNSV